MKKLRVIEAFAGVGSQRMALRNIGIEHEVIGIFEIDKYAIKSYNAIHGDTLNYGDISLIDPESLPDFDLFTYSFPCQDISIAGLKKGFDVDSGTRSSLLHECKKIIDTKKPKYLLLENVKNLVGKNFKANFDEWLEYLESLGYTNYWKLINAKDYNTPQSRERVFVVSILGEHKKFEFPIPNLTTTVIKDYMEDRDVEQRYFVKPHKILQIDLSNKERIKPYHMLNQIGVYTGQPNRKNPARFRVFSKDNIAPTLTTAKGGDVVPHIIVDQTSIFENGTSNIRKLTPKETWRLMGFSDGDYNKAANVCSVTQLYHQSGNSIALPVLESLFKQLFKTNNESEK